MSAWRSAVYIRVNNDDGTERTTADWIDIGNVSNFSQTLSNSMKYVNTLGSKFYDLAYEGKYEVSGSFETVLDFNNFYYILGCLEKYETSTKVVKIDGVATRVYEHRFSKVNNKRVPSFTILIRKLNRCVGGTYDQELKLKGVSFKSIGLTWDNSSGGQVKSTMNFAYCDEEMKLADLDTLEQGLSITKHPKHPVEWGCLQIYDPALGYVGIANNEKTGFTLNVGTSAIGQCGNRFNAEFAETNTAGFTIQNQVYSRKPEQWYLRVYSGGEDTAVDKTKTYQPKRKQLKPIDAMRICSSDTAKYQSIVDIETVYVEGMGQTYNPSSMMTDSPTLKARKLEMAIITPEISTDIYTGTSIPVNPYLEITSPSDNFTTSSDKINIVGFTDADATITITVNGSSQSPTITIGDNGSLLIQDVQLASGSNAIVVANGTKSITINGTYTP